MAITVGGSWCKYCSTPSEHGHADACPIREGTARSMLEWIDGYRLAWNTTYHVTAETISHPPSFELGFDIGMDAREDCFSVMLHEHDIWIRNQYERACDQARRQRCHYCWPTESGHQAGCPTLDRSGTAMDQWLIGYETGRSCTSIQPLSYKEYPVSFHIGRSISWNDVIASIRSK